MKSCETEKDREDHDDDELKMEINETFLMSGQNDKKLLS